MALKKVGYYILKDKCLRVYEKHMKKKSSGKLVKKRVNYKGKIVKKGTKVYKTKAECKKALEKKMHKSKKEVKKRVSRKSKFGQKSECAYSLPYFGQLTPSIANTWSGTQDTGITSSLWLWPNPPGAKAIDMQQGGWNKVKHLVHH